MLSALDDKLELNRQTNATLEAIAQTIFKEWFVDFKFPGATGEMQESELGMIPKGWTALPIYETAEFINGAAYKETDFTPDNSGLPVIKIAELKYGITSQTRFSKTIKNENSRIDNGDILFSWSGSPDTSIDVFVWAGDAGILNQHIFRVVNGDTDKKYYECYLLKYLKPIFIEIARDKQTTGLGHVTAQDMRRIKIAYPDKKSIGMFAEKIGPIFEKSLNNSLQTATLVRLRDSLLPKLMNGEIEA
ncbi:MAG: hypothetical protein A2X48_09435 [Lentisphaerae bacterium GWF2_49_21]|nr:MAG: hypothetical protein A2X48_09435 [Lentisphaerae bacterium GWF2_49_21]